MIIVSGMNRQTGQVRTQSYEPGQEEPARQYRKYLRQVGYDTTFVNGVKERYKCDLLHRGITGYQLHSLGTASGNRKNSHITKCQTDTLTGAIEEAEEHVNRWSDGHEGIVIYRAIKLVRKVTKPTTEIVELS